MKNEIIKVTTELIAIPSVSSDVEENKKALEYVRNYLNFPDSHVTYHSETAHPSLIFTLQPHQTEHTIMFHGHTDVIPADDSLFIPRVINQKIYGRGATDMKGGLAAQVVLF